MPYDKGVSCAKAMTSDVIAQRTAPTGLKTTPNEKLDIVFEALYYFGSPQRTARFDQGHRTSNMADVRRVGLVITGLSVVGGVAGAVSAGVTVSVAAAVLFGPQAFIKPLGRAIGVFTAATIGGALLGEFVQPFHPGTPEIPGLVLGAVAGFIAAALYLRTVRHSLSAEARVPVR
ncbi:MAG: hypothetical protein ABI625_05705 [bacterium]